MSGAGVALRGVPLPHFLGPQGAAMQALLMLNAALLAWRLFMRAHFTARLHGWEQGLAASPRAVVANIVNFLAILGALERYRDALDGAGQSWWRPIRRFQACSWPMASCSRCVGW